MNISADASPLIAFAILGELRLLSRIFADLYIPQAVFDEICVPGKPHCEELRTFSGNRVRAVQNVVAVRLLTNQLDLGEAEAIVLALENGIDNVLVDDPRGRQVARANGLYPVGTIGVLLQAKGAGHIPEVKSSLDTLIANRYRIGRGLYEEALRLADEPT